MTKLEDLYAEFLANTYIDLLECSAFEPSQLHFNDVTAYDIGKRFARDIDRLQRYHNIVVRFQ